MSLDERRRPNLRYSCAITVSRGVVWILRGRINPIHASRKVRRFLKGEDVRTRKDIKSIKNYVRALSATLGDGGAKYPGSFDQR